MLSAGPSGDDTKQLALPLFKVPERPRKRQKILEEQEYLDALGHIIERDFFPDLPKLRMQMEILEAQETDDLQKLREIEMRLRQQSSVRHTPSTTHFGNTPARGSETPSTSAKPLSTERVDGLPVAEGKTVGETLTEILTETQEGSEKTMGLDAFLATHTSEDNASFELILERMNEKKREKYKWVYEKEEAARKAQLLLEAATSSTQPAKLGTKDNPVLLLEAGDKEKQTAISNVSSATLKANAVPYVATNALMYGPNGVPLTPEEEAELAKRPPKEILHANTRFETNSFAKPLKPAVRDFDTTL
jgi:protein DGCR14